MTPHPVRLVPKIIETGLAFQQGVLYDQLKKRIDRTVSLQGLVAIMSEQIVS
jgi:hypothetical protein